MSFSVFDRLKFGAKPIWIVKITINGIPNYLASGSSDFTTVAGTPRPSDPQQVWTKADVTIPDIPVQADNSTKNIDINLALNHPVAQQLLATGGKVICDVEIYQSFRNDANTQCRALFFGSSVQLKPTNKRLRITCSDGATLLDNQGVNRIVQVSCPYALFSSECGVSQAAFEEPITITSGGNLIYQSDLSAYTEGQFDFGRLIFGTEAAVVLSNSLTTIFLNSEMPNLAAAIETGPQLVTIIPGCAKTTSACVGYNNILNYGGFPDITDNPYDGNGIL